MKYNVDYFIKKFEAIPERQICSLLLFDGEGGHCVNGWCGVKQTEDKPTRESYSLWAVFKALSTAHVFDSNDGHQYSNIAARINNGDDERYQQPTPKQRILAALYDIKASEDSVKQTQEILNTQPQTA